MFFIKVHNLSQGGHCGYLAQALRNLEGTILLLKVGIRHQNYTQRDNAKCAIGTYTHPMQEYSLFNRRFSDCVEKKPVLVK
jgi:hypothetical protein